MDFLPVWRATAPPLENGRNGTKGKEFDCNLLWKTTDYLNNKKKEIQKQMNFYFLTTRSDGIPLLISSSIRSLTIKNTIQIINKKKTILFTVFWCF
jgi:hypothetical protein